MKYSEKQISNLLDGIFDGRITEFDLPLDYYKAVTEYLKSGLYKGFGMNLETAVGKDLELLTQLRENVYMFGAAKTYQETKEISSLLTDENGNVRTQKEFNEVARNAYDKWNEDWGKTEYNTAIGQAQSASKWNEIEKQKETLPLLRYSAVIDPNTSEICEPLDGMIAPVDDPIWDSVTPLNHFNCRCVLLQEDGLDIEPTTGNEEIVENVKEEMSSVFINNAGKTGEIFTKNHPYFDASKELGENNFGLPIPDNDE